MRTIALAALASALVALSPQVHAQQADEEVLKVLNNDIRLLTINTPIWLADHLPAMMAPGGVGSGVEIGDESGGFKIGLIPARIGVMNQFNKVGSGTEMVDFDQALPAYFAWPQFGLTLGFGLGSGLELVTDFSFIPNLDVVLTRGIDVRVWMFSASPTLRWRLNEAEHIIPSVVLSLGGSYYGGAMDLGAGYESDYQTEIQTDAGPATAYGHYEFRGAPGISWNLFQICPEVRFAWDFEFLRPYIGVGFSYSMGSVIGKSELSAVATIDRVVNEQTGEVPYDGDPLVYEDHKHRFEAEPAKQTWRPLAGLDIVIGAFALSVQAELAFVAQDPLDGSGQQVFEDLQQEGVTNPYSDSAKKSQVSTTLVVTTALRLQF